MRCYLFDIDGTLANHSHRMHHIQKEPKDWDAFFDACVDDKPIPHMLDLLQTLTTSVTDFDNQASRDFEIVYVSGRSDSCQNATGVWLEKHGFPYGNLYMRKAGDHRPDYVVKGELLDQILADGYEPIMAFDDRTQCVKLWRARGIPCAQVAEGNF